MLEPGSPEKSPLPSVFILFAFLSLLVAGFARAASKAPSTGDGDIGASF